MRRTLSAWLAVAIALPCVLALSLPESQSLQDPCGSGSCSLLREYCDSSLKCRPCSMLCNPARLQDDSVAQQQCNTHCSVYLRLQEVSPCTEATPNSVAPTVIPGHEAAIFLTLLKVNTALLSVLVVVVLSNLIVNLCNRRNRKPVDDQGTIQRRRRHGRRTPRREGDSQGQSEASSLVATPRTSTDHRDTNPNQSRSRSLNAPEGDAGQACPHNCQASTSGCPPTLAAALLYRPDKIPYWMSGTSARAVPNNDKPATNQGRSSTRAPPSLAQTRHRRRDIGTSEQQPMVDDLHTPQSSVTGAPQPRNMNYDEAEGVDASFDDLPPYTSTPQSMPPPALNHQSSEEDAQTSTKQYHDAYQAGDQFPATAQAPPETALIMQESGPPGATPPGVNDHFPENSDSYSDDDSETETGV